MKLACRRCKHKKIKCDKGEPSCHQCITAKEECTYVERKQRPRLAQQVDLRSIKSPNVLNAIRQKVEVRNLSRRLEFLEKQVTSGERASPSIPSATTAVSPQSPGITSLPSPPGPIVAENGQDSWIYRLATDARKNFQTVNTQNSSTPVDTPTPQIDNAMTSLNKALEELGSFKIRSEKISPEDDPMKLSLEEIRVCLEAFLKLIDNMVVPNVFTNVIDVEFLRLMPDMMRSPYVSVDPSVRVLFYNAMHYGFITLYGPGSSRAAAAYLKVLEAVPAWLDTSSGTDLDAHAAALTTWSSIANLDFQLSWKFHCKSTQVLKMQGIDHLDMNPSKTHEEESKRDGARFLFWQVLDTDILFRLFFGKPPMIRWSHNKVKAPALFTSNNMHPKASQTILQTIWISYTIISAEVFNFLDAHSQEKNSEHVRKHVHKSCVQLENMIAEWEMERHVRARHDDMSIGLLYADHTMNIYSVIIGFKRLTRPPNEEHNIDAMSLRAARKIVSMVLDFNVLPSKCEENKFAFMYVCCFVTFYPFCAVFEMYQYILACPNPDDCEDDLRSLENIGEAMKEISKNHKDFVPLSNTIHALNLVSRTIQEERRKPKPDNVPNGEPMERTTNIVDSTPQLLQPGRINLPSSTMYNLQNMVTPMLDTSAHEFPYFPELNVASDGSFQPFGFVRAVENDFLERNWHESWWNMDEDINADINGMLETE